MLELISVSLEKHNYTIWQRGDGKWLTYLPNKDSEKGRRQISAVSKTALEKKIITYYKEQEEFPTFEKIFNLWIEEKMNTDIVKHTVDRYQADFIRFFSDSPIKEQKMNTLTEDMLAKEIKRIIKKHNLTVKAYGGLKIIISGILRYARVNNYSIISPADFFDGLGLGKGSKIFQKRKIDDNSQVFTTTDIDKAIPLLEAVQGDYEPLALGILFIFRTGLRSGELVALKYCDIVDNILHVRRQHITCKAEVKGKNEHKDVNYAKTDAGVRDIVLTQKAIDVIDRMKEINPDGEFIFLKNGKRIYNNRYNQFLLDFCKKNGMDYKSTHKIRKTYGTLLFDGNVDERFIMHQMGHSSISTTQKYYQYCNKEISEYKEQIAKAITI